MSRTAYEREIRIARQEEELARINPNGSQYMSHLWEMVKHETDLNIVLRTETQIFKDNDVRAWWKYYSQSRDQARSLLTFEVADEITRSIQDEYQKNLRYKFFGEVTHDSLIKPILGHDSDEDRTGNRYHNSNPDVNKELIIDDWPRLKAAIQSTAEDSGYNLGGQRITLLGTTGESIGLASVRGSDLEILIHSQMVDKINKLWSDAFRKEVLLIPNI
ncbi:MAG TPA: hypothetical protein VLF63_03695 [Patescibacteria group bacterium]|nr:hypothetical protein [Patescibacteria group bacterium]